MPAESCGEFFQEATRYSRESTGGGRRAPLPAPCITRGARFRLPPSAPSGGGFFWEVLRKRRSGRDYRSAELTLAELSQLLGASSGITADCGGYALRAAPSAGALYPVETYLAARAVEGLAPGLYHYQPEPHALSLLREGDYSRELCAAALSQEMFLSAAACFLFSAVVERSRAKYRERAYRYIYLDAGAMMENLLLAASALSLGACAVGAFYDGEVEALWGLDGRRESALLLVTVGRL